MNFNWRQLQEKTPLLHKKGGKLKDPILPLPRADQSIAVVPGAIAIPFPAKSPTFPTIHITPAIDNTPVHNNNVTVVKSHHGSHAMSDNINISNNSDDEGEIWDVDYFDSLVMNFLNTNEITLMPKINSIDKKSSSDDMFTPSTKKSEITDTQDTSSKKKGQN